MRKIAFAFLCSLLALTALPALADSADQPTAEVAAEAALPTEAPADVDVDALLDPLFDAQEMSPYCSANAPTCSVDSDCDAYCGGKNFGWCVWDHWTNCCGCAG